ncbi:MAG: hypothetical protein J6Y90_07520 [Lachnospiraceae bacterium]|nr:hypothetical protein [Lachnospiraceae bacterium]
MRVTVETCEHCCCFFNYPGFGSKYCHNCRIKDEEEQHKVKEYLREHGSASAQELTLMTGVPESTIRQYLREGMLEIPEGSPIYIKCEMCGTDIRSGRWCQMCAAKLSTELKGTFVGVGEMPKDNKNQGKMHFLDRKNLKAKSKPRMHFLDREDK